MRTLPLRHLRVLVVSVVMLAATFAVVASGASASPVGGVGAAPSNSAPAASSTPIPVTNAPSVAASPAVAGNPAATAAAHALQATRAAGVSPHVTFVPRPSASPVQRARTASQGYVSPLYTGAPVPSGLAYYGLSEGAGGAVVPSILNTTSLRAEVSTNGVGIQPLDLFDSSPDSYGIQLNAVATNITLFNQPGYEFWTQNVVEYFTTSDFLVLVSNVWNFSSPTATISPNLFYAHGANGTDESALLGYYYSEYVVPFPVTYPFDLQLFMNSSVVGGRNAVSFDALLSDGSGTFSFPYDYVIFNSTAMGGAALTSPSNYTANGFSYNPLGLTNDFELIFGGPGGGSQADLAQADATLGLAFWNATSGAYEATPSAFNYGGETGETVTGASIGWASGSGGPNGVAAWGVMSGGPTILRGLWNAGAPEGVVPLTIHVDPSNAWFIITAPNGSSALKNFLVAESFAVPGVYGDTLWLTPGTYHIVIELSDYSMVSKWVHLTSAKTLWIHLSPNFSKGVYTPLWAFSNAQIRAISYSGHGTPDQPYRVFNNQHNPLSSVFGLYNDYTFPVYPGVFFYGTTATTYVAHAASFATRTNDFQYPGPYLPKTNDLQFWFWHVHHVALLDSTVSGWFGESAAYPSIFDTFNVIFYQSSHNLIAGNHFKTQGGALLLFARGTIFGPVNAGGGDNTIWGNWFTEVAAPKSTIPVDPIWVNLVSGNAVIASLGIQLAEGNDLIYNNYVATPITAWMLPLNLYSGTPWFYHEHWNIAPQPAWKVHYASGFPLVPLTGSIVHTRLQGGNFWWDYGRANPYDGAVNPIGDLPYQENAPTVLVLIYGPAYYFATYIYNGGDFHPLVVHDHDNH